MDSVDVKSAQSSAHWYTRCDSSFSLIFDNLLRGRGPNQIQGTVSLTDQTEDNCTEMPLGGKLWLKTWWSRIKARKLDTDGYIHRIEPAMYNEQDKKDFGDLVFPCNLHISML